MKVPSEEEILKELQSLKDFIKPLDFQMGISEKKEKIIMNRLNKIIRMVKVPIRAIRIMSFVKKVKGR